MSVINNSTKEMHCKVVYYGPSLGGKTTSMQWIYQKSQGKERSELFNLPTEVERTIFFDFLPLDVGDIRGFKTRMHLYTVPGQVIYDNSRKLILKGLDGIVFVADSQEERMEENIQSLENLEKNLEQQGMSLKEVPFVIQYNKRDLPTALPISKMRTALNHWNAPDFETIAQDGKGVVDSLNTVSKSIITNLKGGSFN
jgi:signal recognition particle receptor subunit beta